MGSWGTLLRVRGCSLGGEALMPGTQLAWYTLGEVQAHSPGSGDLHIAARLTCTFAVNVCL